MSQEQIEPWRDIQDHREFGGVTAAWLRGQLDWHPTYAAPTVDEETRASIRMLAAINEHGFVTDCSQPGVAIDEKGSGQRAFVAGYCSEAVARQVQDALRGSELVVMVFPPGKGSAGQVVVTLDEGDERCWCGLYDPDCYIHLYEEAGPELVALVEKSWYLDLFDPVWGRNDRLLPLTLAALGGDPDTV